VGGQMAQSGSQFGASLSAIGGKIAGMGVAAYFSPSTTPTGGGGGGGGGTPIAGTPFVQPASFTAPLFGPGAIGSSSTSGNG